MKLSHHSMFEPIEIPGNGERIFIAVPSEYGKKRIVNPIIYLPVSGILVLLFLWAERVSSKINPPLWYHFFNGILLVAAIIVLAIFHNEIHPKSVDEYTAKFSRCLNDRKIEILLSFWYDAEFNTANTPYLFFMVKVLCPFPKLWNVYLRDNLILELIPYTMPGDNTHFERAKQLKENIGMYINSSFGERKLALMFIKACFEYDEEKTYHALCEEPRTTLSYLEFVKSHIRANREVNKNTEF